MNKISFILPICDPNPISISRHIDVFSKVSESDRIKLFIIDDCSKEPFTKLVTEIDTTLARIDDNIKWNVVGAVNLGMTLAKEGPALVITEDHFFKKEELEKLLYFEPDPMKMYLFERFMLNGQPRGKRAPGTALVDVRKFLELGGYDEDFCRGKGYSDWFLYGCPHSWSGFKNRKSLAKIKGMSFENINIKMTMDNSVAKKYKTSLPDNMPLYEKKLRQLDNKTYKHPPILNFNWRIIYENSKSHS